MMNTTKLKNIGSFAMFASWILGMAVMVIASVGHAGLACLALGAGVAMSVVLYNKYNSKVVKGIESLQKEVTDLNASLTTCKSKAAEWESKYDKTSSDLADTKAELEKLRSAAAESIQEDDTADAAEAASSSKKSSKKK